MPRRKGWKCSDEVRQNMAAAAIKRAPRLCSLYGFTPEFVIEQKLAGKSWCSDCKNWYEGKGRRCSACSRKRNDADYAAKPEYHRTRRQLARKADPERAKAADRAQGFRNSGITEAEYRQLLAEQGGGCAICGVPPPGHRRFSIDHNHKCCAKGSCSRCRRGLLCDRCNLHLFWLECPWYDKALAYLARYPLT